MLTISKWANRNLFAARILLGLGQLTLTWIAFQMGQSFSDQVMQVHPTFLYGSILFFLMAFMGYPDKSSSHKYSVSYKIRKSFDFLLALSTFMMIFCLSAQTSTLANQALAWMPKRISSTETKSNEPTVAIPYTKIITKKAEKKQLVTRIMSFLTASQEYTSGEKLLYTFLAILGAAALLYLVTALACNLSCNGAEGAAIAVSVVGVGAIIFLFIKLMKHLNRNPSISHKKKPSSTTGE